MTDGTATDADAQTYPPARHVLRDLAATSERLDDRSVTTAAIQPGLCVDGGVRLGVVATLVDMAGAGIALATVAPDWIATADLVVHLHRPVETGPIEVVCTPLRTGAKRVVIEASIRDGDGRPCGAGRMAFSRIPGSATSAVIDRSAGGGPSTMDGGRPVDDAITRRCGFVPVGPGQLTFPKDPYVQNSFGTVNGGVLALACDDAAVSAAGTGHGTDLHIHYLEQIGDGPVAVTAEVVRTDRAGALTHVRVVDRGTGRPAAVADVRVAQPEG